jgi:ATP-dependent protease HslVU (ClpYQ) peptidase subunit
VTCIAVLRTDDKTYMAGDRGASDDDVIMSLSTSKIWRVGEYLIGYAGTMDGERIRHNFNPPPPDAKDLDKFMQTRFIKSLRAFYNEWWVDTSKDSDFGMIICVKDRVYEHSATDMSLSTFTSDYLAMGSGASYALGYLHATEKVKDGRKRVMGAVGSAIKFSPTCIGPIDVLSI